MQRHLLVPAVAIVALIAPSAAFAGSGTVKGTITTDQKSADALKVTRDNSACGDSIENETLIVKDGKLANAVVYVSGVKAKEKVKGGAATLNQRGCRYVPHVQAVNKGTELTIINSDAVLHNVHSLLNEKRTLFNVAMPLKDQKIKKKLKKKGVVSLKCDAGHGWMSAYIHVFDHPYYAVVGEDGSFTIEDVPEGEVEVKVWHEKLGEKSQKVTVKAGETTQADFKL